MADELLIPPAALADKRSVEMIRVWAAKGKLHCVLNIGVWENRNFDQRDAWGILLADLAYHIANAHEEQYRQNPRVSLHKICKAFVREIQDPQTDHQGKFVAERRKPRRRKK